MKNGSVAPTWAQVPIRCQTSTGAVNQYFGKVNINSLFLFYVKIIINIAAGV